MGTEDPDRFHRVASLVVDVGGQTLRMLFLHKVLTNAYSDFHDFLNQNKVRLQANKLRCLNHQQLGVLFPTNGSPANMKMWDITLMSALLLNYFTLGGIEKTLIQALRNHRNVVFGHAAAASINEKNFKTEWQTISSDIVKISQFVPDVHFQKLVKDQIKDLETQALSAGPVVEVLKIVAQRETQALHPDIQLRIRNSANVLENHRTTSASCTVTVHTNDPATRARQILETHYYVTIVGEDQDSRTSHQAPGKTPTAMAVMDKVMTANSTIEPILIVKPSEIGKLIDTSLPSVVLMNDLFGADQFKPALLSVFCNCASILHAGVAKKNVLAIVAITPSVKRRLTSEMKKDKRVKSSIESFMDSNVVVDLASKEFRIPPKKGEKKSPIGFGLCPCCTIL